VRACALRAVALGLCAAALFGLPANAQSAKPGARPTAFPTPPPPKTALHTSFIVATNKKGQVVTVQAEKKDRDSAFNLMTYGNALQMFIRTASGEAIPGRYRVTYDYLPETKSVRRNVALVGAGGVDPDAIGAVERLRNDERRAAERAKAAKKARPSPLPLPSGSTR
jgi:hypothetical protein